MPKKKKPKENQEPESDVKKAITKLVLRLWPDAWEFMPVQTGYGKTGVPDHLFAVPVTITPEMVGKTYGMFVAIEAKRYGKTPRPLQRIQLVGLVKAWVFAKYVAGLIDIPKLEADLRRRFNLNDT